MAGRREWVPCVNWGNAETIPNAATTTLCQWGEDELYVPYAADSATFLRLRGHIVISDAAGVGTVGWRVRLGLDPLSGGAVATAGALNDFDVAEEHYMDERFWHNQATGPSLNDHPYWTTFDTRSKRRLDSPAALIVSMLNFSGQEMRVEPYLRALMLFP